MPDLQSEFDQLMTQRGFIKKPVKNYIQLGVTTDSKAPYQGHIKWEEVGCIGTDISSEKILPKFRKNASFRKVKEAVEKAEENASVVLVKGVIPSENMPNLSFTPYPFNNVQYFLEDKKLGNIGGVIANRNIQLTDTPQMCYVYPKFEEEFEKRTKK